MIAAGNPDAPAPSTSGTMNAPLGQDAPDLQAPITSDPFWPDIGPAKARAAMRLDGTVTPERLRAALIEAITLVNSLLNLWREDQQTAGHNTLADTSALRIDDVCVNVHRYRRAVFCYATANLQERLRNFDSTVDGHKRADALTDPIDDHRRDARWAVSDILCVRRTTIELI